MFGLDSQRTHHCVTHGIPKSHTRDFSLIVFSVYALFPQATVTMETETASIFPLLDLPRELRDLVYEKTLENDVHLEDAKVVFENNHDLTRKRYTPIEIHAHKVPHGALLFINRQINKEYSETLSREWKGAHLHLRTGLRYVSGSDWFWMPIQYTDFSNATKRVMKLVKNVNVDMHFALDNKLWTPPSRNQFCSSGHNFMNLMTALMSLAGLVGRPIDEFIGDDGIATAGLTTPIWNSFVLNAYYPSGCIDWLQSVWGGKVPPPSYTALHHQLKSDAFRAFTSCSRVTGFRSLVDWHVHECKFWKDDQNNFVDEEKFSERGGDYITWEVPLGNVLLGWK